MPKFHLGAGISAQFQLSLKIIITKPVLVPHVCIVALYKNTFHRSYQLASSYILVICIWQMVCSLNFEFGFTKTSIKTPCFVHCNLHFTVYFKRNL